MTRRSRPNPTPGADPLDALRREALVDLIVRGDFARDQERDRLRLQAAHGLLAAEEAIRRARTICGDCAIAGRIADEDARSRNAGATKGPTS